MELDVDEGNADLLGQDNEDIETVRNFLLPNASSEKENDPDSLKA